MTDLTGKQFRMVTNMKAAPNSQGTLFQGGNPTRYPRHFTPERRASVQRMLEPPDPAIRLEGNQGRPSANPSVARVTEEHAIGMENIYRSSIPAQHLAGLAIRFGALPGSLHLPLDDANGIYKKLGRGVGNAVIRVGRADSSTVTHEIGHHYSNVMGTNTSAYNTPHMRGAEEAFAENYAETHYRDYAGKREKIDRGPEDWAKREDTPEARNSFREAFHTMRQLEAPAHSNWGKTPPLWGNDAAPEQMHLLRKFASGDGTRHWDYEPDLHPDLERETSGADEARNRRLAASNEVLRRTKERMALRAAWQERRSA